MSNLNTFNPLENNDPDLQLEEKKKNIKAISSSFGWYGPFCEAIQNALDSIEQRINEDKNYEAYIWITINLKENCLIVTDNGIGLDKEKIKSFLRPYTTFKNNSYRGHIGVGATYLAYCFNYVQICSKIPDFSIIYKMENAKKWLDDDSNQHKIPKMIEDDIPKDANFSKIDQGFSICIAFDSDTQPKDLSWLQAKDAQTWLNIMRIKTGLGAINKLDNINVKIRVINKDGSEQDCEHKGIDYLWIHDLCNKKAKLSDIKKKKQELKRGTNLSLFSEIKDLKIIYDSYTHESLNELINNSLSSNNDGTENLEAEETLKTSLLDICKKYEPYIYFVYSYSENFWNELNRKLTIRKSLSIFKSGIQIASNNMPQGDIFSINYDSGNTDKIYLLIHFNNYVKDGLGFTSFQKQGLDSFAQEIAKILIKNFSQYRNYLEKECRETPLQKRGRVNAWKLKLQRYADSNPLTLPKKYEIPTICIPSKEQEVVALFNQLLGAKIICGIECMTTDQKFMYDCLFRYKIEDSAAHIYHKANNPLGLLDDELKKTITVHKQNDLPLPSYPQVLEYKFSMDKLSKDLEKSDKNSNDIDLLVVWKTGDEWRDSYRIVSCLDSNYIRRRPYHGVTHIILNRRNNQEEMYLIVLEELLGFLNNSDEEEERQKEKYR